MAKGYRETAENSRKLPERPVPGRKKSCYAQEVFVEEEDLKAHCQDQKISHHVGNADLIRGGTYAETATADIDAPVNKASRPGRRFILPQRMRLDLTDLRQPCQHTLARKVAESTLHVILLIERGFHQAA